MRMGLRNRSAILLVVVCALAPPSARAGVFNDVAFGLGFAGFQLQGQENILSGGADFAIVTQFQGNELDFGSSQLTLAGPLSLGFSTGGRDLSVMKINFQTALNSQIGSTPLTYTFNTDVGGQISQVTGSLLIDGSLEFNGFGFYDLQMEYSARQTVDTEGRFSNDQEFNDFDIGPINIRGNIFADLLSLLIDPLFANSEIDNPFASFSGQEQLKQITDNAMLTARELALGSPPLSGPINPTFSGEFATDPPPGVDATGTVGVSVPEPTTLLLMLTGVLAVTSRKMLRL